MQQRLILALRVLIRFLFKVAHIVFCAASVYAIFNILIYQMAAYRFQGITYLHFGQAVCLALAFWYLFHNQWRF